MALWQVRGVFFLVETPGERAGDSGLKFLAKYLSRRTFPGPWVLSGCPARGFRALVVIPALAERRALPATLESLARNPANYLAQTLVVVVVNQRLSANAAERRNNSATLDWLATLPRKELNLAWCDASSPGLEIPPGEGVGLARKIGFDLGLCRLNWQRSPFLVSLDADTLVDENYLSALFDHFDHSHCAAATLPFRHQPGADCQAENAIRHYELYLRSYQFGLHWAGSPYAFIALGSALACRGTAYIAAGGMKRRLAGEDFYFLQQLAKIDPVAEVKGTLVQPEARFSQRVPFGTGRAVQARVEEGRQLYHFFSPASFQILRRWLMLAESGLDLAPAQMLEQAAGLSAELGDFLQQLDFASIWQRLQANHGSASRRLAFHQWFDGLRTRQLLSRLEAVAPESEFDARVSGLLQLAGGPLLCDWQQQLAYLEFCRREPGHRSPV
jgi:hypothetical protein